MFQDVGPVAVVVSQVGVDVSQQRLLVQVVTGLSTRIVRGRALANAIAAAVAMTR